MAGKTQPRPYEDLSETEKATVVLLAMGEQHAAKVFDHLEQGQIARITDAMSKLGPISSDAVNKTMREFRERVEGDGSVVGNFVTVDRFLRSVLPEDQVNEIMQEIQGPVGDTVWDKLPNIPDQALHNFLTKQHPQVIALVLANLAANKAGRVFQLFPKNEAYDIALRMARLEDVPEENREKLESMLNRELISSRGGKSVSEDGSAVLARILNRTDQTRTEKVLSSMEEDDQRLAKRVRNNMFTFNDLLNLEAIALRKIAGKAESEDIAKALANADEDTRQRFFSNMAQRSANAVQRQMDEMGRVRRSEIEQARMRLIEIARELENQGEIVIQQDEEEDG